MRYEKREAEHLEPLVVVLGWFRVITSTNLKSAKPQTQEVCNPSQSWGPFKERG